MKTLNERLKHAREKKNWSQGQLAAAAGLGQSAIGNIEAGTRKAPSSLPQIAEALGINYKWLANGIGPMIGSPPGQQLELDDMERMMLQEFGKIPPENKFDAFSQIGIIISVAKKTHEPIPAHPLVPPSSKQSGKSHT